MSIVLLATGGALSYAGAAPPIQPNGAGRVPRLRLPAFPRTLVEAAGSAGSL
jgi:hypothetical protein